MARHIRLAAIAKDHLNLNGDIGNLVVLRERLRWRNVSASIDYIDADKKFRDFDFVLIGHGSEAAWDELLSIHPQLLANVVEYIQGNGALMAVASASDRLLELLNGEGIAKGARFSGFVREGSVVGYLNSDSKEPRLIWEKNALLSQLHGPLLAKNSDLADEIIAKNGWADVSIVNENLRIVDELAAQSRRIAFEH